MRPATRAEIDRWDDLVLANPDGGNMLQSRAWGEFKRGWGWRPAYLVADDPDLRAAVLFLRLPVPGLGGLWYAPKGPGVRSAEELARTLSSRRAFEGAFCVQVEPELADTPAHRLALTALGLRKVEDVQISRATAVVDLSLDEQALLASFRPKTRYNIRLAGRHGVRVEAVPCDEAGVTTMYALMGAAFERAGYPLRPLAYYAGYWRLFEANGQGQLFLARLGDEVLAGAYVIQLGDRAWYKDGGSVTHRHEVMAPHLVQWEAMRWLRGRGVRSYDLFAVPTQAQVAAGDHALGGLMQFKAGFTSDLREFVGTWDLVLDEPRYRLWRRAGEPLARRLRWRRRRDLLY
jgi:lipid II:glycine glycyltransferase (peptidoglycan interpeptide bridge formation enzyme)